MALKFLPTVREEPQDYEVIEKEIKDLFRKEIYLPLIAVLGFKKTAISNSKRDLLEAIQSGQITFYRGHFKGKFDSTLSRELRDLGAKWDRKQGSWTIPQSKLPIEIKNAISLSETAYLKAVKKLDDTLKKIVPEKIAEKLNILRQFDTVLSKFDNKFKKTIESITIQPKLSSEQKLRISEDYSNNMKLYVRDFVDQEVKELRKKVESRAFDGFRYEGMIESIQKSYNVSANKAKFLARQETSIFMAKFHEVQCVDAGITKYKWSCVKNAKDTSPDQHTKGNVRYYHALNDQKIFTFKDGAVVNEKGERKNPGEDYNCRCIAIPVVEF